MLILDDLLNGLHDACAAFPDKRKGAGGYSMADIGLSAFSLFFMQSESFLSYQRSLEEGRKTSNCHTLFGMKSIPTDNHIRSMLDPVHPSHLQSSFDQVVAALREKGGMNEFQRLGGRALIALDGTEYFCSYKLGCPDAQALEWKDRILPFHVGGDHRRAGPQHGRAADAGVHRQAGRRRETGLRAQCRQALADNAL